MELVLRREFRCHFQSGIGIEMDAVAAHELGERGAVGIDEAKVHGTGIEKTPFQQSAPGQLHGGRPQPGRIGRIRGSNDGRVDDRVNLFPDASNERRAVIYVAVLLAEAGSNVWA